MHPDAQRYIADLGLEPHPEGGYYRQTFASTTRVATPRGERSALTSILFILAGDMFSAFHSLCGDETWHFYRGSDVALELLGAGGRYERRTIGPNGPWQVAIPAGVHFAAALLDRGGYALVGCDVAPGFDFDDFSLSSRAELNALYPSHAGLIERFTRP